MEGEKGSVPFPHTLGHGTELNINCQIGLSIRERCPPFFFFLEVRNKRIIRGTMDKRKHGITETIWKATSLLFLRIHVCF